MLTGPAAHSSQDRAYAYKKRLGVLMFFLYATVYAGFVGINLVRPALMGRTVAVGLNLAVVYGFGLIVFAVLLALVYNRLCSKKERQLGVVGPAASADGPDGKGGK